MKSSSLISMFLFALASPVFAQFSFMDATGRLSNQTIRSGAPIGSADMNNDGLDDIIRLDQAQTLYIAFQASNGNFTNYLVTSFPNPQWSVCVADADRNNYNDIFTGGSYNGLKLAKADNAGATYSVVSIPASPVFLQGSNFADINRDGLPDIFACHDDGLSLPLRNLGNSNFVTDFSLINPVSTIPSDNSGNYGSVWIDYNNDGFLDLYISKCREGVANPLDGRRLNLLFRNNGNGSFTEVAESAGLRPLAQSWAADFADIDNDGDLDCFLITHDSPSRLFMNNGNGTFSNITVQSGISPALNATGPGLQVKFEDFDNDGFVDLLYTAITGTHWLFRNNGNRTFTPAANTPFPTGGARIHTATVGDFNNDGYMDVYAGFGSGYNTPGTLPDKLFINQNTGKNFLKVRVKGIISNPNGIGARIEIHGQWGRQIREVRSGESYGIMNTFAKHFGLNNATQIDSLIVRWPSGIVDRIINPTVNQSIQVQEGAHCIIDAGFAFSTSGNTVSFQDRSTLGANQWFWNFGNGQTSTLQNPVISFTNPGVYLVCLTATGACGQATRCLQVNVNCNAPIANFSNTSQSGLAIQFNDLSTNQPNQWLWNFGNGQTSTQQNPIFTYQQPGTYQVCLTASSICGSSQQFCRNVTATCNAPSSLFLAQTNQLTVLLNDLSSGNPNQWNWNFGNGQTSTLQNPIVTFNAPGTYRICLVASSVCGLGTQICQDITLTCNTPLPSFVFQSNGLQVELTDQSSGNPTQWNWTFSNGQSSSLQNPQIIFSTPGTYEICLQTSSICGQSLPLCQTIILTCTPPFTGFVIQTNGLTAQFTDLTTGNPTQWNWTFSTGQSSTQQNPQITFPQPGIYQVCLTSAGICGMGNQVCQEIEVTCTAPSSSFMLQTDGLALQLTDQSTGNPTQWNWTFSTGQTSTLQNPQITFPQPGTYQICLQTSSVCGQSLQACQSVTVTCTAPFSNFILQTNGLALQLTDQSTGNPTQWNWTFSTGQTSTLQNPQITFPQPGTYQICLQTSSVCGQSLQACQSVTVTCTAPFSNFMFQTDGLALQLTDQSTGNPTQWNWTFSTGQTSTLQNPQITFPQPGTYQICLQTSSICGQSLQACQSVTVSCAAPISNFAFQTDGLSLQLTDQSTGSPTQWIWTFSTGQSSTQQNPQISFSQPGTYQVCLTSSGICGMGNPICRDITVSCTPPSSDFTFQINGFTVQLINQSTGNPNQWSWTFSNGQSSNLENPEVTFSQPGTYQICLETAGICGESLPNCQAVTINCAPPVALFSITNAGTLQFFVDASQNQPTQWLWNFGDGNSSTQQNPLHLFPGDGIYTVCLIVSNACGIDTICQNAVVGMVAAQEPSAAASFIAMPNPAKDELSIAAEAHSTEIANISLVNSHGQTVFYQKWPLKEGRNSLQISVHEFPPGLYALILQGEKGRNILKIIIL